MNFDRHLHIARPIWSFFPSWEDRASGMAPPPSLAAVPTLSLSLSLPPRPASATLTPSAKPHGLTSSKTARLGIGVSPRVGRHTQSAHHQSEVRMTRTAATARPSSSPMRPKRPLSASRVPSPTSASKGAGYGFSPRTRPASASLARSTPLEQCVEDTGLAPAGVCGADVDEARFFLSDYDLDAVESDNISPPPRSTRASSTPKPAAALPVTTDPVVAHAKFQAFVDMWEEEQAHFRSSVLFSETTFAQAKAMVSDWSRPNVLLSSIALGSLEQLGHSLEKQFPFLRGLVNEVGAAMYTNFEELTQLEDGDSGKKNRFLLFFQRGRLWCQALEAEQQRSDSLEASDATQRSQIEHLNGALQEQKTAHVVEKMQSHARHAVRVQESAREDQRAIKLQGEAACYSQLPLLARLLIHGDSDSVDNDLDPGIGSFHAFVREIECVFSRLSDRHAHTMLRALLDSASADRDHKPLAHMLAVAVDALDESARREFLREYFAFVANDELQDALRERDESNDAKRLASFVSELFDTLGLDPTTSSSNNSGSTTFHSDQARVIKSVLDRTELLQEIAAEFCFLDEDTAVQALPEDIRRRLRAFETPSRRLSKAQQLMTSSSSAVSQSKGASLPADSDSAVCTCTCGHHRLADVGEQAEGEEDAGNRSTSDGDDGRSDGDGRPRRRSRRRSSAGLRRRKNGVNFGNQLASSSSAYGKRGSASQRLFPLSEVCRLLTSILHLQFSRDAMDEASAFANANRSSGGGVSMLSLDDDRWAFLRRAPRPNFKTLARDFLTRKYGIKSIAIMHALQLERSLVHYTALLNHTRCDLFAWFVGADRSPARLASRDYGFRFFQSLVKTLLKLLASKKPPLSSSSSSSSGSASMALSPLSSSQPSVTITNTPRVVAAPLSYSSLVSIWTESIGDGEVSSSPSGVDAKALPPAVAIETCRLAFPRLMQDEHPAFGALLERFYRAGLSKKPVELEGFLRRVMDAWEAAFEAMTARIDESMQQIERLDFDGFGACLAAHGLELTGGERLELFDLLTNDSDAFGDDGEVEDGRGGRVVVARKRLAHFLLETKYLLPVA